MCPTCDHREREGQMRRSRAHSSLQTLRGAMEGGASHMGETAHGGRRHGEVIPRSVYSSPRYCVSRSSSVNAESLARAKAWLLGVEPRTRSPTFNRLLLLSALGSPGVRPPLRSGIRGVRTIPAGVRLVRGWQRSSGRNTKQPRGANHTSRHRSVRLFHSSLVIKPMVT